MTLKRLNAQQAEELRDSIEDDLQAEVGRQMRGFTAQVRDAALAALNNDTLVAAAGDDMPGMGTIASWWATRVDEVLVDAVRAALVRSFNRWSDITIERSPAQQAANEYLARVRDRLVLGTHMGVTVYEGAFDKIRTSLAAANAEAWTTRQLAERIAVELDWAQRTPYWREQLATVDRQIDDILDTYGEPGNAIRENARMNDPHVQALRDQRNLAVKHLDAERSEWQTRATLIARTESTGASGFGSQQSFILEGVATKLWEATGDNRTRETHRTANGQEVGVQQKFAVGVSMLEFPGDPSGAVQEVAGCRCTMLAGDFLT